VADLGERPGGAPPPLFWVKKKKKITEGRKAGKARKTKPPPAPNLDSRSGSTTCDICYHRKPTQLVLILKALG